MLDLGSGTGILGLMACRAGARRVYAVDDGNVIELARMIAHANGFTDRVVHIQGHSTQTQLPELADVVVADQIGFASEYGLIECFCDARDRLLVPGGSLVPCRLDMLVAPVACAEKWSEIQQWTGRPMGYDLGVVHPSAMNTVYSVKLGSDHVLGTPALAGAVDLTATNGGSFALAASIPINRSGVMHGIGGWFSATLAEGVCLTNSPVAEGRIDRSASFFPLEYPLSVQQGDRVEIRMHIMPTDRILTWKVEVWEQTPAGPSIKASFAHSTWKGMFLSPDNLKKLDPAHTPCISTAGKIRLAILELCDGTRSLAQIEEEVWRVHPELFRSRRQASILVAEVVSKYAQ